MATGKHDLEIKGLFGTHGEEIVCPKEPIPFYVGKSKPCLPLLYYITVLDCDTWIPEHSHAIFGGFMRSDPNTFNDNRD